MTEILWLRFCDLTFFGNIFVWLSSSDSYSDSSKSDGSNCDGSYSDGSNCDISNSDSCHGLTSRSSFPSRQPWSARPQTS